MIYLDSAATTLQKPKSVQRAVLTAMESFASPGRGGYDAAMRAAQAVFDCRVLASELFSCSPEQVVFTMNATHALNIAIKSLVSTGDEVVISGFEHNAVVRPLTKIGTKLKIAGTKLFSPEEALACFDREITTQTKAVVCTHVSNVFGYVLPVEQIAALCAQRGVPLILDASQSAGIFPVSLKNLRAAFIAMPGHKSLYGPQGTGILLCNQTPKTLLEGGTGSLSREAAMPDFLPDMLEAGTLNVAGIHGLAAGLSFVKSRGLAAIRSHENALKNRFALSLSGDARMEVFTSEKHQSGVVSVAFANADCEQIAQTLAAHQIAVRAGLHCAPLAHESAGTLARGTVRFSFSAFTTPAQVDRACEILKKIEFS